MHNMDHSDSFKCKNSISINGMNYNYFDLTKLPNNKISKLPYCIKILLENLLRTEDNLAVTKEDIEAVINWDPKAEPNTEIAFTPSRVILQDFTGVPAIVDLATMREAVKKLGGNPKKINPLSPVELVIDHSVMVDYYGSDKALAENIEKEYERNQERYEFLRWGQQAFDNFRVVPPGTGIVHQVNLEYLGRVVFNNQQNNMLYPDTLVGTDSHTTMINGLGVLGWGVGGIEAEAAMLGQPITMLIPQVVGFELTGQLAKGATATDLVLEITKILRQTGVVGKFVEFYGDGLENLTLADRATISNMSPEFGATSAIFPIDQETINYLKLTGRKSDDIAIIEQYSKAQGLFHTKDQPKAIYSSDLKLDLSKVEPCIAGPKRPQDKIALKDSKQQFLQTLASQLAERSDGHDDDRAINEGAHILEGEVAIQLNGKKTSLKHGDVVIAAITSCTNTSNPAVMLAAGLIAKKAQKLGVSSKPWVKTSLAPGSQVVTDYLNKAGLTDPLNKLGFNLVGYGCTTCIGNSGPLPQEISSAIHQGNLSVSAVLSGNRNFEGRIHPEVRNAYLASPPLVVMYAIAGTMNIDLFNDPIANDKNGNAVFFKDLWPTNEEIQECVQQNVNSDMFTKRYASVFDGDKNWQGLSSEKSELYNWVNDSTYVKNPPFFNDMQQDLPKKSDILNAKVLAKLGDSVTTDHISPAGAINPDSPAGNYLIENGIAPHQFNSYGSRRGNHEVMMRGTFANIRLNNQLAEGKLGGFTKYLPTGEIMSIYDAAMQYQANNTPLIVLGGKEYGTGSSRDWAAKGTRLLGVKAVIAESFERIHRSNLIGMGVLPLQFKDGESQDSLGLTGNEEFSIKLDNLQAKQVLAVSATNPDTNKTTEFKVNCRIDTPKELEYYKNDGILHYVLRQLAS